MSALRELLARPSAQGFVQLLGGNLMAQALAFATSLTVARLLSAAEFGDVKVLQSYLVVLTVLATGGLNAAVLKVCAVPGEHADRLAMRSAAGRRALVTSGIALVLAFVLSRATSLIASPGARSWLLAYALLLPFAVRTDIGLSFLNALKRFKASARAQVSIRLLAFVLIVALAGVARVPGFVAGSVLASALGLLLLLRTERRDPLLTPLAARSELPRSFRSTALLAMLGNGVDVLGHNADIFLLDHFVHDRAAIGHYGLAALFLAGCMQVTATVQTIAVPHLSARATDRAWVRHAVLRTGLRSLALGGSVALAAYLVARLLVPLVYGAGFAPVATYLGVLLVKYLVYSVSAITGITLFSLGLIRHNLWVAALATATSFGASALLLPRLGVVGAAWGQVCGAVLVLVLQGIVLALALREAGPAGPARSA